MQLVVYAFAITLITVQPDEPCAAVMNGEASSRKACVAVEVAKLGDRSISMAAVQRLSGLAPESIQPLRTALKTGETAIVRANAADALGRIGPKPPEIGEAVPDLIAVLTDEDVIVRRQAAGALGRL